MKLKYLLSGILLLALSPILPAQGPPPPPHERGERPHRGEGRRGGPKPGDLGENPAELGSAGVVWYPILRDGLKEAKRSHRPILFMAVASQCGGIPGVF